MGACGQGVWTNGGIGTSSMEAACTEQPGRVWLLRKSKMSFVFRRKTKTIDGLLEPNPTSGGEWFPKPALRFAKDWQAITHFYDPRKPGEVGLTLLVVGTKPLANHLRRVPPNMFVQKHRFQKESSRPKGLCMSMCARAIVWSVKTEGWPTLILNPCKETTTANIRSENRVVPKC